MSNTYLRDTPLFGHDDPVTPPPIAGLNARIGAHLFTGDEARQYAMLLAGAMDDGATIPVAADIETVGLNADALKIKCVTFAAASPDGRTYGVLLDPRRGDDYRLIRAVIAGASTVYLHNAPFDVPSLYQNGLMTIDDIGKVYDTIVTANIAYPGDSVRKSLESLAARDDLLSLDVGDETMKTAFSVAGSSTIEAGFAAFDIDRPVYCLGAMADTVATLRLASAIHDRAVKWLLSSPFTEPPFELITAPRTVDDANRLIYREQTTNRVMLRRSARGIAVDRDYLQRYHADHEGTRRDAVRVVADAVGVDNVTNGLKVAEYLHAAGLLPDSWPTTPTGRLKADAASFESLNNPVSNAYLSIAKLDKITNYLDTVDDFARVTGRIHPQVNVLKAVSGRMSYSNPALQQFSADARPILVPDSPAGWTSIDWSSIEPVVMANCAHDRTFIDPFNNGGDLYIPTARAAGLIPADLSDDDAASHPGRKTAKVVVLAAMYGQGRALLSKTLGVSEDDAARIQNGVRSAMPDTWSFMDSLRRQAEDTGVTSTADGRLLPVPRDPSGNLKGYVAVNYFCQGSAYSVMSEAINAVDAAGYGDDIVLSVHDELVVEAGAADAIRDIMTTPPSWLNTYAAPLTPVFKTDANALPDGWRYV